MLALAREITREAERLIYHASPTKIRKTDNKNPVKTSALQSHAYKILSLLSDTRFCDAVGKEIPTFPAIMVGVAVSLKRYDAPIQLMVRRTVIAMLKNKESALFVENEWLGQGFIGNTKPITRAVFENWHFLEKHELGLESPLDLDYPYARTWDVDTWRVYFGMAREYIHGLTSTGHSNWDARGIYYILKATGQAYEQLSDLKKCEDVFNQHNPIWHAREANEFICDLAKEFDKSQGRAGFERRVESNFGNDLSSKVAALFFESMFVTAQWSTRGRNMWNAQYNTVWSAVYHSEVEDTKFMKMVRRKLRRMVWDEIVRMDRFPNYRGAAYVSFCLNVLGFYDASVHRNGTIERDSWPLTKVVSGWVKKNYQTIAISHPPVAEAMLPANIEYDSEAQALVRTHEDQLTGVPRLKSFGLDQARGAQSE